MIIVREMASNGKQRELFVRVESRSVDWCYHAALFFMSHTENRQASEEAVNRRQPGKSLHRDGQDAERGERQLVQKFSGGQQL